MGVHHEPPWTRRGIGGLGQCQRILFLTAFNIEAGTAVFVGLPQGVGMDFSGGTKGSGGEVSKPLNTATT